MAERRVATGNATKEPRALNGRRTGIGPFANSRPASLPGREQSSSTCPGGCASLHHRLSSVAPPGLEIAPLSSPAVSSQSALVKSYELAPGALRIRLVLSRLAVIRHAPSVRSVRIDFDLCGRLSRRKGCFEFVFHFRLALVIIGRDGKIESRLDFRDRQMRAVGSVSDKAAAMKGNARADTVGEGRRRLQYISTAQTISDDTEFLFLVDLLLRFQKGDESDGVPFHRARREMRSRHAAIKFHVGGILDRIEPLVENGRLG